MQSHRSNWERAVKADVAEFLRLSTETDKSAAFSSKFIFDRLIERVTFGLDPGQCGFTLESEVTLAIKQLLALVSVRWFSTVSDINNAICGTLLGYVFGYPAVVSNCLLSFVSLDAARARRLMAAEDLELFALPTKTGLPPVDASEEGLTFRFKNFAPGPGMVKNATDDTLGIPVGISVLEPILRGGNEPMLVIVANGSVGLGHTIDGAPIVHHTLQGLARSTAVITSQDSSGKPDLDKWAIQNVKLDERFAAFWIAHLNAIDLYQTKKAGNP